MTETNQSLSLSETTNNRIEEVRSTYQDLKEKFGEQAARVFLKGFLDTPEADVIRQERKDTKANRKEAQLRLDDYITQEGYVQTNQDKAKGIKFALQQAKIKETPSGQNTPSHIQDYINTLDNTTRQRVSEHVEYTEDGIDFKVKIKGQNMLVPFNYHNATKAKDIIKDGNGQVVTKEVNINGKNIKETYFRWNWLNNTYDLQDTVKKDSLYKDTLDDDLRYLPTDTLYEQLLQAMPAGDYSSRRECCEAGKQLSGLLGVQLTGCRSGGGDGLVGDCGCLWSASVDDADYARALLSHKGGGLLDYYFRALLFPVRTLRTPPRVI